MLKETYTLFIWMQTIRLRELLFKWIVTIMGKIENIISKVIDYNDFIPLEVKKITFKFIFRKLDNLFLWEFRFSTKLSAYEISVL